MEWAHAFVLNGIHHRLPRALYPRLACLPPRAPPPARAARGSSLGWRARLQAAGGEARVLGWGP